jgi:hypothetical protein
LSTLEGGWRLLHKSTDDDNDDAIEECDSDRYDRDKDAEGDDRHIPYSYDPTSSTPGVFKDAVLQAVCDPTSLSAQRLTLLIIFDLIR